MPATQAASFQHQIDQIMSAPPAQTGRLAYAPTSAAATPPPPTSIPPQQQQAPSTASHMAEAKGTPPMGGPFPPTTTATSEPKAPAINTTELLQGLTSLGILQGGTPSNVVSTPTPPPMIQEQQQHASISTPPQHSATAGIRLESKDLQMCVLLEHGKRMGHRTDYHFINFVVLSWLSLAELDQAQWKCCIRGYHFNANNVASDIQKQSKANPRWMHIWILISGKIDV